MDNIKCAVKEILRVFQNFSEEDALNVIKESECMQNVNNAECIGKSIRDTIDEITSRENKLR
jgi:hypothetical protein